MTVPKRRRESSRHWLRAGRARHALRTLEFKVFRRLLRPAPSVCVGSHADLRCFLHEVHCLLHTGIQWRDLPRRFGLWNCDFYRYQGGQSAQVQ